MRVVPDGLPCGCGARGCIEQYGSGRALLRMANEIADVGGDRPRPRRRRAASTARSTGTTSARCIAAGDPGALRGARAARPLARAGRARALSAVLDPQLFVFGGGVAQCGRAAARPRARGVPPAPPGARLPPRARVRDRRARQRRRRRGRRRPRPHPLTRALDVDAFRTEEAAMFYWFMKNLVAGPILQTVFRPWVIGRREHPEDRRRHPRQQPPLVHRLDLPAARHRSAHLVPRQERLLHAARASRAG